MSAKGHTSKPNGMNSALTYALYFLVQKELGNQAPMPTNQIYWTGVDDCSDAALIADLTVWASTTPRAGNQAFNAVNGDYIQWQYMWPRIAAYLGADSPTKPNFKKPYPEEGAVQQEFTFGEWAKDKQQVWEHLCDKAGVPEAKATWAAGTWAFQDWVFQRAWCSTLSFNKAREFGYTGYRDSYKSITGAFENFRACKQIP